ncbi:MAG: GNAT family N-acetyltransferase [Clostridia bacterium]|nr:GNAT family N-acetyltransferase [Clostridia bacterium]
MVRGGWFVMGSDITLPLSLRQQVFGRGEDAIDPMAQQVVVYENDAAVGTARLWWQDGAFRLGDVGVLEDKRGRGFGDLLVRLLLYKALTHEASLITLACPEELQSFFAQYGFETVEEHDGLMEMSIRGEDVHLSHCGGNCAECGHRSPECVPKALREE